MPSELKTFRVEDLIADSALVVGDGYRAKNNELGVSGIPFARAANINDGFHFDGADRFPFENVAKVGNKVSKAGDVVFTSKGTVGRFAFVSERVEQFLYSPQLCFWRSANLHRIRPRFLYYWMQSVECLDQINYLKGQTDMADYVSLRDQRRMTVSLPSPQVQDEISETLSALDDKICLLRETNATLEAITQAIFKSWFVDFDPVRAKVVGRDPEGMPPEMADLFPSEFEESELGEIPKGWRRGTLADFAELNPESWSNKSHPEILLYVDLANTKDNRIELVAEYSFDEAPSRARRVLRDGDTIVGTVRPGNRSFAFIQEPPLGLTGSTGFAVLRPRKPHYSEFVFIASTRTESIDILANLADGGAYPAVRPELVQQLQVVVPSESILLVFHEITSPLMRRVGLNNKEIDGIAGLRDTLLPRLMSGKLPVLELEDQLSSLK
jgi:type I restriction enzyme S subunit